MAPEHNAPDNNRQTSLYSKGIRYAGTYYQDLKSNIVLFLAIAVIITGTLVFINSRKGNTYSASFTVVYEELVKKVYGDRLLKLNTLLKTNKPKAQEYLAIDEAAANSLLEISPTNILGDELSDDVNTDKIPFVINVVMDDTAYVDEIQKGIIHYLETSNEYLEEKRRLKRQEIDDELAFIEEQLALMDTLKRKYRQTEVSMTITSNESTQGNTSAKGSGSVYEVSYQLYKKKQELLKKKKLPMNLYVIDDAIVPVKNNKPYVLVILAGLIISVIVYTVVAYLLLPVVRYRKD